MSKIDSLDKNGNKVGQVELNQNIFESRVNTRLLNDVVRLYGNNKRAGTSSTKTFGEVSGGGKKPWKQKGTGRARTSSIRNPLFRGGGTIFGPRPRTILNNIPKTLKYKAIISALSLKNKEGNLIVLESAKISEPKTKEFFQIMKGLDLVDTTTLCIVENADENIERASRNIPKLKVETALHFNAYHVMRKKKIVIEKDALQQIEKRLQKII